MQRKIATVCKKCTGALTAENKVVGKRLCRPCYLAERKDRRDVRKTRGDARVCAACEKKYPGHYAVKGLCPNCYYQYQQTLPPPDTFTCTRCKKSLPGEDKKPGSRKCRTCYSAEKRAKEYRTTPEYLFQLYEDQKGRCAACGVPETFISIHVDHDHETWDIRGLLCGNCNKGSGLVGDSLGALRKLEAHLRWAKYATPEQPRVKPVRKRSRKRTRPTAENTAAGNASIRDQNLP